MTKLTDLKNAKKVLNRAKENAEETDINARLQDKKLRNKLSRNSDIILFKNGQLDPDLNQIPIYYAVRIGNPYGLIKGKAGSLKQDMSRFLDAIDFSNSVFHIFSDLNDAMAWMNLKTIPEFDLPRAPRRHYSSAEEIQDAVIKQIEYLLASENLHKRPEKEDLKRYEAPAKRLYKQGYIKLTNLRPATFNEAQRRHLSLNESSDFALVNKYYSNRGFHGKLHVLESLGHNPEHLSMYFPRTAKQVYNRLHGIYAVKSAKDPVYYTARTEGDSIITTDHAEFKNFLDEQRANKIDVQVHAFKYPLQAEMFVKDKALYESNGWKDEKVVPNLYKQFGVVEQFVNNGNQGSQYDLVKAIHRADKARGLKDDFDILLYVAPTQTRRAYVKIVDYDGMMIHIQKLREMSSHAMDYVTVRIIPIPEDTPEDVLRSLEKRAVQQAKRGILDRNVNVENQDAWNELINDAYEYYKAPLMQYLARAQAHQMEWIEAKESAEKATADMIADHKAKDRHLGKKKHINHAGKLVINEADGKTVVRNQKAELDLASIIFDSLKGFENDKKN